MIKLAALLMGAPAMRRRWPVLTVLGIVWLGLGLAIMADAADGVTVVATESFGYLLLVEGFAAALVTAATSGRLLLLKSLALVTLGLLIIDMPWRNDIANSLLFGIAFLVDGLVRVIAALVLRHARWKASLAGGLLELVLAVLAFSDWPISYQKTVPFCIGVALLMSGVSVVHFGLLMRRLPYGLSVTRLPLFRERGWHVDLPPFDESPKLAAQMAPEPLVLQVWTPLGAAENPARRPFIDRYVAAIDRKGVISTGHAALMLLPDLYISHYPGQDSERSAAEFTRMLRATPDNDVPGRFLPSYAYEVGEWFEADAHVAFHRFDAARLAACWEAYRQDHTYNLTNRNCSIAVAVALDAALEGVLARQGLLGFLWLMINPDFWLAAALRSRAEAVTWTPGMLLDYARALRRVTEPRGAPWLARFGHLLRRYRAARAATASEVAA